MDIGILFLSKISMPTLQKNLTSLPIIHELLKHQSHYYHRVFTAYKISGYDSSSGKKKPIDALIRIRILIFLQVLVRHGSFNPELERLITRSCSFYEPFL